MELRVAIVDDMNLDRNRLSGDLKALSNEEPSVGLSVREYESAEPMLADFRPGSFDLAFLDIRMDDINGIELARRLRALDPHLIIIFITTSRDYAFEAFPVHPFDYLVKPYNRGQLRKVLLEALRTLAADEETVTIRVPRGVHEVPLYKLVSVESRGHVVEVHLSDGHTLRSTMTFSEVSKLLEGKERFLACNRGIIVNMDQVMRLDDGTFRMKDGSVYPLRVRNRSALVQQFSQYMISRVDRGGRA